ncbi:MAG: hypothetical protein JST93_02125 [Acidobacteria bacterium]|nr:hypothetical protein [Acidobacteriota bacterium]
MVRRAIAASIFLMTSGGLSAAPPRIFFSDLESGPNTGGQNNGGVFVTLHGARFGATPGTSYVSIGAGRATNYPIWSDAKVTFQLGSAATTGEIRITTPSGASNAVPFTVRSGKIYFVAVGGSDSNNGSFAKPWRTLLKARDSIEPGDTVYAMDGVSQTSDDGQGWRAAMLIRRGGTVGAPMALVAYPGATVTVGNATGPSYGIRTADSGICPGFWVFSGLVLRGLNGALILGGPSSNWRVAGNDLSCPNGNGQLGCLGTGRTTQVKLLGNNLHHAGAANASSHYHGIYISTDSNQMEAAWNTVAYVRGCRGIQVYSSPLGSGGASDPTGRNIYDLSLHDNLIHDTQCDGIILSTVDPSRGKVEIYNNVIYNAGQGPNNPERTGYWSCIMVNGSTANGAPGGGTVEVFGNTLYNCGTHPAPPYANAVTAVANGGNNHSLKVRLRNNIIYQPRGVPYWTIYGPDDGIQGTSNLFFGNGAPPSNPNMTRSLNADPQFANLSSFDFHLKSSSPARKAGVETGVPTDKDGNLRGGDSGIDLGALQYAPLQISALTCNPPVIRAPGATTCIVSLDQQSPSGGLELAVSTDSDSLAMPQRVFVPAGASTASFVVNGALIRSRGTASLKTALPTSSRSVELWLLPAGDPSPALYQVVNAASLQPGPIAPGGLVAAFGSELGQDFSASTQTSDGDAGMAPVSALFDEIPAQLLSVQPQQLNAMVPYSIAGRSGVRLEIEVGGRRSNPLALAVMKTAPGVFTVDSSGMGQAAALNDDGTANSSSNPARRESTIAFYAAGLGETDPPAMEAAPGETTPQVKEPITALIGGITAAIVDARIAPGPVLGLYLVSAQIPAEVNAGSALPLLLTAAGAASQPGVTIAIQ